MINKDLLLDSLLMYQADQTFFFDNRCTYYTYKLPLKKGTTTGMQCFMAIALYLAGSFY